MSVKVINSEDFANAVKDGVSVVDFNATWCGPCKMLGPVLEKLSDEITDVKFYAMDVDENPDIAEKAVFRDGAKVDQNVGFIPEASMRSFIEKNK